MGVLKGGQPKTTSIAPLVLLTDLAIQPLNT